MAKAKNAKRKTRIEKALVEMLKDGKKEIWDKIGGQEIKSAIKARKRRGHLDHIGKDAEDLWIEVADRVSPKGSLRSRDLFMYALILCENMGHETFGDHKKPGDLGKLYLLFDLARKMQLPNGNFKWRWRDKAMLHRNAVDFCMWSASLICRRHKQVLKNRYPKTWKLLVNIIKDALPALKRREPECFTNTYLKNVHNLIILGETFNWPQITQMGYRRLDRFTIYTWEWGIHEYASPTYTGIHANCLGLIYRYTKNEKVKEQAKKLLEVIIKSGIRNLSVAANEFVGTRSRRHTDYFKGESNVLETLWVANVSFAPPPRKPMRMIYPALYFTSTQEFWVKKPLIKSAKHPITQDEFPIDFLRKFYFESIQRQEGKSLLLRESWGPTENESRTTYFSNEVTLGTSSASYDYPAGEDLPLTAELIGSPFIHENDIFFTEETNKTWHQLFNVTGDAENDFTDLEKKIIELLFINQSTSNEFLKIQSKFTDVPPKNPTEKEVAQLLNQVIEDRSSTKSIFEKILEHLNRDPINKDIEDLIKKYLYIIGVLSDDEDPEKTSQKIIKEVQKLVQRVEDATEKPDATVQDILWGKQEGQKIKRWLLNHILKTALASCCYLKGAAVENYGTSSRCYFLPDTEHDPYGKNKKHHAPLHWAATQNKNMALGLALYKQKIYKLLESNFVMPINVDEIWINRNDGGPPESFRADQIDHLKHYELSAPQIENKILHKPTLVLRKGCAVIGIQVVWANNLKGGVPPIQLCYDGLDYEHFGKIEKHKGKTPSKYPGIRLTIQHHLLSDDDSEQEKKYPWVNPGIAILVKTDQLMYQNLKPKSFKHWCEQFHDLRVEQEDRLERWKRGRWGAPIRHVEIGVPEPKDADKNIIKIATTYSRNETRLISKLTPSPSRAILEVDNPKMDEGRKILQDLPIIQAYNNLSSLPHIEVSGDQSVNAARWSAEKGRITAPIRVGIESKRKHNKFIWIPHRSSNKQRNDFANALWQVKISNGGDYYIWGRIKTPHQRVSQFYFRLLNKEKYHADYASTEENLPQGTWITGLQKEWTWVPLDISEMGESAGPTPIKLEKNETYYIQLFFQRTGIKLQELYITNRWDDTPEQQDRRKYRPKRKP